MIDTKEPENRDREAKTQILTIMFNGEQAEEEKTFRVKMLIMINTSYIV